MSGAQHDPTRQRYTELKRLLEERRREILAQVQDRENARRAEISGDQKGAADDDDEGVVEDEPTDIDIAIHNMKLETLHRIEEALVRLEAGQFGDCSECGDEISVRRLRALPFTLLCKDCDEEREVAQRLQLSKAHRKAW